MYIVGTYKQTPSAPIYTYRYKTCEGAAHQPFNYYRGEGWFSRAVCEYRVSYAAENRGS